jgi:hypothetical protein
MRSLKTLQPVYVSRFGVDLSDGHGAEAGELTNYRPARKRQALQGQAWSSCPDAQISVINSLTSLVMRSMPACACRMSGGSADSQRRQALISMTRAAKVCLISGATVVDCLDSLTN